MLKVSSIHMPLKDEAACRGGRPVTSGPLVAAVALACAVDVADIARVYVLRRSIDARKKKQIHFVISAALELVSPALEAQLRARGVAAYVPYKPLEIPFRPIGNQSILKENPLPAREDGCQAEGCELDEAYRACRPVVVGTGPAGLFAALYLARAGMRPVVLERGGNVEQRSADVAHFNTTGQLNEQSNIQFGEGGAGTFSDGKLTTNTNNEFTEHVLHWFAQAGAPPEILWEAQPHIGSDRLPAVVSSMRKEIIAHGGDVLFNTHMSDLRFESGRLCAVEITGVGRTHMPQDAEVPVSETPTTRACVSKSDGGSYWLNQGMCLEEQETLWIPCTQLVLACGHSARDTFALLQQRGVHLEQKPFSVGVRIEHSQAAINKAQWGPYADHPALGAASYKLAAHGCAGRSVYTFCMCPGGEVVCAASEEGGIATNGMSPFARDGSFANAAVLVNVVPEDFGGSTNPLAGVQFQREIEQRAYAASLAAGGKPYQVPAQSVASFLRNNGDENLSEGSVAMRNDLLATMPGHSCARETVPCNLGDILPAFVCEAIAEALPQFDRKLAGFASPQTLLLAPETRSSSPVRIARNEAFQAWLNSGDRSQGCGIYPAGEGAGYAGGIMSAACDGLRVACQLVAAIP